MDIVSHSLESELPAIVPVKYEPDGTVRIVQV